MLLAVKGRIAYFGTRRVLGLWGQELKEPKGDEGQIELIILIGVYSDIYDGDW